MRMIGLAGLAGILLGAGVASAQEVTFRFAHWVPPTHPVQVYGIEPWIESMREASGGRIDVQIFPAAQLGAPADHYDMARDGIADFTFINPGYQAGRFPVYGLVEIPFHMNNAMRGAVALHEWYMEYAGTEMSDVRFCIANPHDPGTIHSKVPVRVPADLDGLNVRPANATMARFVSSLGAGPVQVPATQSREAIANGTADGITFPWNSIYIFGIDAETKHHLDMPFYVSGLSIVMNSDAYDRLPDDLKAVVDDHCTPDWSGQFSTGWAQTEAAGRQKMIDDPEHVLYEPTPEEVQLWRDASAPLVEAWKADVTAAGFDADAIYEAFVAALDRHDARF